MNVPELTLAMIEILRAGGFKTGGMNFDAKIRRQSIEPDDLLHAHVGSMDAMAKALVNAAAILEDGMLQKFVDDRYAGWSTAFGKEILAGKSSLEALAEYVADKKVNPRPKSGRQEHLEGLINRFG
jgi:xylose isomerase